METVAAACWGGWFVVFLRLPLALLASALFSSQTSALSHEVIPPIPLRSPRRAGRRLLSSLCCGVFFFITSSPPTFPSLFISRPRFSPSPSTFLLSSSLTHSLSHTLSPSSSFFFLLLISITSPSSEIPQRHPILPAGPAHLVSRPLSPDIRPSSFFWCCRPPRLNLQRCIATRA